MTELGQVLKQTREEKNITLDELQSLTKIQKRYLQAIEDGNYTILPGDFYVRAFIKQYADAIGLDHDEVLINFKHEVPQPPSQEEQQEENLSRVKKHKDTMPGKASKVFDYMPQIVIGTIVVGIAVALWFFWPGSNKNVTEPPPKNTAPEVEKSDQSAVNKKDEKPAKKDETVTPPPVVKPKQEVKVTATTGKRSTIELKGNETFTLEISSNGESYLQIKNAAGKSFYVGTLEKGQNQTLDLNAENEIIINAGYTPALEMKINGEVVPFPLSVNDFAHQIITVKNLRTATQESSS